MNTFRWIKKNKVASFLLIAVSLAFVIKAFIIGVQVAKNEVQLKSATGFLSTYFLFICLLFISWVNNGRVRLLEQQTDWLIDATNWNVNRLKTAQSGEADTGSSIDENGISDSRWPWGPHHTETLGHLEAAARKWWVLYDPSDLTTAPTNEMVSDWLQTERGISKDKAREGLHNPRRS